MALGPTLWPCFEPASPPRTPQPESVLEGRRNLRQGGRRLGLFVSRGRLCRRDDRVHVVAQTRLGCGEVVPAACLVRRRASASGNQRGWPSSVCQRSRRTETIR